MSPTTVAPPEAPVSAELDRISLAQALLDVEVANSRVIDLTARLTEAHAELQHLRTHSALLAQPIAAPVSQPAFRSLVAPPLKAIARRVLPASVRVRIRRAMR